MKDGSSASAAGGLVKVAAAPSAAHTVQVLIRSRRRRRLPVGGRDFMFLVIERDSRWKSSWSIQDDGHSNTFQCDRLFAGMQRILDERRGKVDRFWLNGGVGGPGA